MSDTAASMPYPVITIDGPTASGKGTVAHQVADLLGFHLLDSGSLYRLVALESMRENVDDHDVENLVRIARELDVRFKADRIWLKGEDVSLALRHESVGNQASAIAVHGAVREALHARQRAFLEAPGLVADGRDMGTVVFHEAVLKVFLTASVQARAERRYKQLIAKGFSAIVESLSQDLEARDLRDRTRSVAPLRPAQDARQLDSSDMTVDEVVAQVLDWYRQVQGANKAN